MGSLTTCVKKAEQAGLELSTENRRQVFARSRELHRDGGLSADDAARQALDEQISAVAGLLAHAEREDESAVEQQPETVAHEPAAGKIADIGEKIGGARKDTATSSGTTSRRAASDDDRPAWARRFKVSEIVRAAGQLNAPRDEGRWVIRDARSLDWMKQPRQVGRETFATKEDAEAFVPIAAVGLKHRPVPTRDGKYEIWRDITDRKRVKVVDRTFDSRDDALGYMAAHAVEIIETSTTFGEADMPLPPDRARTGPPRREGDVSGEDFKDAFGFRGVEFGNWNNQEERQALMNDAWDGLMDLAEVLGLPPRALGLNGDLALAFGARGHGLNSARAHYERERAVINLTKERGAGSLAHEWFHALDHYLGRQDGKAAAEWVQQADGTRTLKVADDDYVSHGFSGNRSGVRAELREAYDALIRTMVKKAEGYVEDTARVDQFTARAKEDLAQQLDALRRSLAEQKDPTYWKRNNKPASAEQLAEFDAIAQRMLNAEASALATEWRSIESSKNAVASRWTNDSLEQLSAIYKAVRGRSGFDSTSRDGLFDKMRGYMDRYSQRLKMLAEAQAGTEKQRMVPTDFAMNAKELDQGRGTDYWTTPHEMAARAFQGYVEDKVAERGGTSRFLNYAPESAAIPTPWGFKRPFPGGAERAAINAAFDKLIGTIQTRVGDAGDVALFSRSADSAERQALRALAENDELFALPRSKSIRLQDIVADIDPRFQARKVAPLPGQTERYRITTPDGETAWLYVRSPNPHGPTVYGFDLNEGEMSNVYEGRPGENPDAVPEDKQDVVIDVSKLKEGSGGQVVYAMAGDFAHNTGRIFIGDPAGLSDEALRRRSEAMLSSALRWGSTEHLAPHPRQEAGAPSLGVPPLRWVYGDDLGNIRRLVDANLASLKNAGLDDAIQFDPATGEFEDATGARFGRSGVEARVAEGLGRGANAGSKTLARAAVLRALLREASGSSEGQDGRRDVLLARVASLAADADRSQSLSGLFRRDRAGGDAVANVQDIVNALTAGWANAPPVIVVRDMADDRLPQAIRDEDARQRLNGAVDAPAGVYWQGTVYVIASAATTPLDVARTLFHEVLGHFGLRGAFGGALAPMLDQLATLNRPAVEAKAREYGLDLSNPRDRRAAAEEVLAELAETRPDSSWVRRAIAAIRTWLREHVPLFDGMTLSDDEIIRTFIAPARGYVERGRAVGALQASEAPAFSRAPARDPVTAEALRRAGIGGQPSARAKVRAYYATGGSKAAGDERATSATEPVPVESPLRLVQRKLQDDFNRFTVLREWAEGNGVSLTPESNVWAFEERMRGRMATRIEDFREKVVKPIIKAIQDAGFTMDQVGEYLHAQHAEERNRQIESIDPENKSGSGMETAAAAAILAGADPKLAGVANQLRAVTDQTRAILLKAGIITPEMAAAWQDAYKHYVPLKGGDEGAQQGAGKALSVNGKQHRALGHAARDEHIAENILRDHERAIVLAEKNIVGHSMLAFIHELANPDIATIGKPEKRKMLAKSTSYEVVTPDGVAIATCDSLDGATRFIQQANGGLIAQLELKADALSVRTVKGDPQVEYMARPTLAENEAVVYLKGHEVRVQLNDPLLARAYTKLGVERLNALMRVNREINGWLSKAYTGLNPEFLLVNVVRDMTTGLMSTTGRFGAAVTAKAMANYPKAFASLLVYSFSNHKRSTPAIDAFRAHGGTTGAAYLSDIERIGADIQRTYDDYQGMVSLAGQGKGWGAAKAAGRRLVRLLTRWIEHLNAAGEGAMRLAVFEAVSDTPGQTVNDAASAAKNSSVNFNRRGEWGPALGAMYLFFNPAVQGTANLVDVIKNGAHRNQAIALAGAFAAGAFMLAAGQFSDDEGRKLWASIPDHKKNRNLIIRTGTSTYIMLPLPYDWGSIFSVGTALFDLQLGESPSKIALRIAANAIESFSPVSPIKGDSPDATGLVELVPGVVGGELGRDAVRLIANRDGLGRQIVPESRFDEGKPDHLRMWRTTKGTMYDKVAGGLSSATGGTKSQSGAIDVSPQTLKFWTEAVVGGAGRFWADLGASAALGVRYGWLEAADPHRDALAPSLAEIPIVRRFAGETTVQDRRGQFWRVAKDVEAAHADLRRAFKANDLEGAVELRRERGKLLALAGVLEKHKDLIKAQRDHTDSIMADESTTLAYKRAAMKASEEREAKIYANFLSIIQRQERSGGFSP